MPQTLILESFEEFKTRQGCDFMLVKNEVGWRSGEEIQLWIGANGSRSDGNQHYDPPPDPKQQATLQHHYCTTALEKETKDFVAFKSACLAAAENISPDAAGQLRAGAARIRKLRKQLDELNEQLRDPAEEARQRQREEMEASRQAHLAAVRAEIMSINIEGEAEVAEEHRAERLKQENIRDAKIDRNLKQLFGRRMR